MAELIAGVFSSLPQSRRRGWKPEKFLLGAKGGRCPACQGKGYVEIDLNFLGSAADCCSLCLGRRFSAEMSEAKYQGASIGEVLELNIQSALKLFSAHSALVRALTTLLELGLGHLSLGSPWGSLSNSSLALLELASAVQKNPIPGQLLLLDQTFSGLSQAELGPVIGFLRRLLQQGASAILITHDPHIISLSDYVLELSKEDNFNIFSKVSLYPLDQFKELSKFVPTLAQG